MENDRLSRDLERLRTTVEALVERVYSIERRHIGEDARDAERERNAEWNLKRTMGYFGLLVACSAVLVNIMNAVYNAIF